MVFLPIWSLNYPETVIGFLRAVKILAFFEFLPIDWFTDGLSDMFGLSDCSEADEKSCLDSIDEAVKQDVARQDSRRLLEASDQELGDESDK